RHADATACRRLTFTANSGPLVFMAADESLRDASHDETAEREELWKLLVGALYSEAMLTADELGTWQYASPDGWVGVTIRFTP
ncbi:hypothetical protein AB4212_30365, partial [Streptomyces sp. 2MCAF27]